MIEDAQIRVLGEIGGIEQHTFMRLRLFVGTIENYTCSYSKDEVDHVFLVPVDWFLTHEPEAYESVITTVPSKDFPFDRIPGGKDYPWRRRRNSVLFFHYEGEVIWGLTARIIWSFIQTIRPFRNQA